MVDLMNYTIKFQCTNCYSQFDKKVKKGQPARGRGGTCPVCGCEDGQEGVGNFLIVEEARTKILLENRQGPMIL